ncbi:CheR family methyltransferase [Maridesulfovibrio sp. FT414]|uniref:CheR family methyltransferase n=1 Tax=Maridesulfovibrio sp. FT414 TaxID=2979469 RepID=UPI003D8006C5
MRIGTNEFDLLRTQIYKLCGLRIPDGKEYLIEHRLAPLLHESGCSSWMEFYELLCRPNVAFRDEVVSAISTNETSFFRDSHPFVFIRDNLLPGLVRERKAGRKIRIWCAASSTGQEPYSLSMLIHEFCSGLSRSNVSPTDFSILATDISGRVLDQAQTGVFSRLELSRGLPSGYTRYFERHDRNWKVNADVRSLVSFRKFNLLNSFGPLGKFDFVMCRNVLIYFDDQTKVDIVHRIHELLPDKGYLMLGATETLAGHTDRFAAERSGPIILYRKGVGGTTGLKRSEDSLKNKKAFSS